MAVGASCSEGRWTSDRRRFFALAAGAVASLCVARAQKRSPLIGFLHDGAAATARQEVTAFRQGLGDQGFVQQGNVTVVYRWTDGRDDRLPALADDLVRQGAALIVAGGASSIKAARDASGTIPIVFVSASGFAGNGLAVGREHPDSNMTGVSLETPDLMAERLKILHQIAPELTRVIALVNPATPNADVQLQYLDDEAKRHRLALRTIPASAESDLGKALVAIALDRDCGLVLANDGFLNSRRVQILALTSRLKIPAAFANREFVEAGGLASYGPSFIEAYRKAGGYAGRLLQGAKPSDLPIEHAIEFELAINAKTAKSLGLTIPAPLLTAAAEVIA